MSLHLGGRNARFSRKHFSPPVAFDHFALDSVERTQARHHLPLSVANLNKLLCSSEDSCLFFGQDDVRHETPPALNLTF